MTFYLIRHGETDWNKLGKLQGTEDIALNETGRRQSAECAAAFHGVRVDRILTSPLQRASVTAQIISDALGGVPVVIEPGLTERDFGKLSGLTYADRADFDARGEDPCLEPFEPLIERLMAAIRHHADEDERTVIVVSHGASLNAILSHLSGGEIGTGVTTLKNACISKLTGDGESLRVEYFNMAPDEFGAMPDK